ncbi:glutamate ABC transporter substrate-binding protein [Spirillospora albida]|uniref:glutamate ABC transporter substrate-binding protein n=1 Tax=Spirillospora albida TaxID=58123 RepID=UPI000690C921|nr:glutamate ABC transporter substrate-binding protein [Spirillospora albida]
MALALTGCTAEATTGSVAGAGELVIGVKADQPGLGLREGGEFRGFEVDVGTYIARHIGASRVTFKAVTSADRDRRLNRHEVDLVLASYSITPARTRQVTFAGPYYLAHQDLMVRRTESRIRGARDMAGRRMCQASGSVSTERVTVGLGVQARLVPAASYGECVEKLRRGEIDVVSTGDLVLAGFAARHSELKIVNAPFTDEPYGVALRKGDIEGCEAVNRALTLMYQDGTAGRLLRKWFGRSGLRPVESVPEFQGCS